MASLNRLKNGKWRIQFKGCDDKRRTLRLEKISKREAESVLSKIEHILNSKLAGTTLDADTASWIGSLSIKMRKRLEACRFISPVESREVTLIECIDSFIASQDVKESTLLTYDKARRNLLEYFGESKLIHEITAGDALEFRNWLTSADGENLRAKSTARKRISICKQFFNRAIKKKQLTENPFDGIPSTVQPNAKRAYRITEEESRIVLDACPDAQWRLIFGLCRWGALRCPSEVLRLKWEDILWNENVFVVHASKTEAHQDGGIRRVPIFPELEPLFREAFAEANPSENPYVITRYRQGQNLGVLLRKIVIKAGLNPWPKICQNLRSTRESELFSKYPDMFKDICSWLGHTPEVAMKHYIQSNPDAVEKVTQKATYNPTSQASEIVRSVSQKAKNVIHNSMILAEFCEYIREKASCCNSPLMGRTGLETIIVRY